MWGHTVGHGGDAAGTLLDTAVTWLDTPMGGGSPCPPVPSPVTPKPLQMSRALPPPSLFLGSSNLSPPPAAFPCLYFPFLSPRGWPCPVGGDSTGGVGGVTESRASSCPSGGTARGAPVPVSLSLCPCPSVPVSLCPCVPVPRPQKCPQSDPRTAPLPSQCSQCSPFPFPVPGDPRPSLHPWDQTAALWLNWEHWFELV